MTARGAVVRVVWWLGVAGCFSSPPRPAAIDADTDTADVSDTACLADGACASLGTVAVGEDHACALLADGSVRCWGDRTHGQLGDGTAHPSVRAATPVRLPGKATAISAGANHTCALDEAGAVWCWGRDHLGQCGGADATPEWLPRKVAGGPFRSVAAGRRDATCAVHAATGEVVCWGQALNGQPQRTLTDDDDEPFEVWRVPTHVSGVEISPGDAGVSVGTAFACAGAADLRCWGASTLGELGRGRSGGGSGTAVAPLGGALGGIQHVAAGSTFACAVPQEGGDRVWCWGDNRTFQAGQVAPDVVEAPLALEHAFGGAVAGLVAGRRHACARLSGGTVECWGDNAHGTLGSEVSARSAAPVVHDALSGVVELAAGWATNCARVDDGRVVCWGDDRRGQLGAGAAGADFNTAPAAVSLDGDPYAACGAARPGDRGGDGVVCAPSGDLIACPFGGSVDGACRAAALSVRDAHACALVGGQAWCWGDADAVGGSQGEVAGPTRLGAADGVTAIAAGRGSTCVVSGGGVSCFGDARLGEPAGLKDVVGVFASSWGTSCAVKGDGTLWCWGFALDGQARDADAPAVWGLPTVVAGVAVDPAAPVVALADDAGCAVDAATGAVRCWGAGEQGQLGRGDGEHGAGAEPVDPPLPGSVVRLSAGGRHVCALLGDGRVFCWGDNRRRVLAQATTMDRVTAPVEVPSPWGGAVVSISTGALTTCVATAAGEVWCWGDTEGAVTGFAPAERVSVPAHRVAAVFGARSVSVGDGFACAASGAGLVSCWGRDDRGQLGRGVGGPDSATPRAVTED